MELIKKEPIILVVAGKSGSGKDTFCKMLKEYVKEKELKTINLQFSSYIKTYAKNITNWDGSEDTKPRTLLQELGTEIIRNNIDKKFFINRIIDDIKVYSYFFDIITISDARLPEELDEIYSAFNNVYKINIKKDNVINKLDEKQSKHHTEIALDNYDNYNFIIENNGSLDELKEKMINIIDEVI